MTRLRSRLRLASAATVLALSACSVPAIAPSISPIGQATVPVATASATGQPSPRATPPPGFLVFPGASAVPLPSDDITVAARWTTAATGSAPYDFYRLGLPESGFPVLGLFPGGGGAVIRFVAGADDWQVEVAPIAAGLQITLRPDRP